MKYEQHKINAIAEAYVQAFKMLRLSKDEMETILPRNPLIRHYVICEMNRITSYQLKD